MKTIRTVTALLCSILIFLSSFGTLAAKSAASKVTVAEQKREYVGNDDYEIDLRYPVYQSKTLNAEIQKRLNASKEDFSSSYDPDDPPPDDIFRFLKYTWRSTPYKNRYVTVELNECIMHGGIHPYTTVYTICFDTKTNKQLEIGDIFKSKSNYLSRLSSESRKMLKNDARIIDYTYSKEAMINGTDPDAENFNCFALTTKGLRIIFQQYQVAPYAAGVIDIVIPYSELSEILAV